MRILRIAMDGEEHPTYTFTEAFYEVFGKDNVKTIWWQTVLANNCDLTEKIVSEVTGTKYDAVFMQIHQDGIITERAAKAIQEHSIGFNWTGDVRRNIDWYIKMGKYFVTCFTNLHDVSTMRNFGLESQYLQIGYDYKYYYREDRERYNNIVFCANYYPNQDYPLTNYRKEIVIALKKEFPNNFHLYGGNWQHCGIKAEFERVNNNEESNIYRSCGIAINCSHFNYSMYSSDRLFREMACGAFVLSHNFHNYDTEFKEGKHLVTFKNTKDLIAKCHYWLERKEERAVIGNNAAAHVLDTATWVKRLIEFKFMINYYKKHVAYTM